MIKKFYFSQYVSDEKELYIGDLALRGDDSVGLHNHDFYEFFIVIQGQFEEICNGKRILLKRRHLHVLHPDDVHQLRSTKTEETSILRNIAMSKTVFEEALNRLSLSPEQLHGYFIMDENTFISYVNKSELVYGPYPDGQTFDFLMNNLLDDMIIAAALQHSGDYDIPKWLKEAYQAMETEENSAAGLPRLLELTGKSQAHLTRAFQRYYRMTPTDYINLMRLQNASRLLRTSQETIIDIIYRCGYNSVSYFNRLFKAHYGMTPREYRQHKNYIFKSI